MSRRWWVVTVKRYYILQTTAHKAAFNSHVTDINLAIIFFNFYTPNVIKNAMLIENTILPQYSGNRRVINVVSGLKFYSI